LWKNIARERFYFDVCSTAVTLRRMLRSCDVRGDLALRIMSFCHFLIRHSAHTARD
jgi:hypothetical protein